MPKIKAIIEFECEGDVSSEAIAAALEVGVKRHLDNVGLSTDDDEGYVEGFTVTVDEPQPDCVYLIDIPDYNDPSGAWVTVGEPFANKAEAIAWAKENLGADDQGNINVISETGGEY